MRNGEKNTAVGYHAVRDCSSGGGNTAVGYEAGHAISTGSNNVCVGQGAGEAITTANANTCIGRIAGNAITTGEQNVCIGNNSAEYVVDLTTGTYNVCVGAYSRVAASDVTKEVNIGYNHAGQGSNTAFIRADSGAYKSDNTTTWSTTSDRRIKKNIVDNNVGLEVINKIQVRNFEYKTKDEILSDSPEFTDTIDSVCRGRISGTQIGVIAQEIQTVLPETVLEMKESKVLTVDADSLTWHLVNAVKELSEKNDALAAEVASLKSQINN